MPSAQRPHARTWTIASRASPPDASRETGKWTDAVGRALDRACAEQCVTRAAILDAVERGVIAPPTLEGGWLVRREDGGLALYVVTGRGLTSAKGACRHHLGREQLDGVADATVEVSRLPFREDAGIECRIDRTERRLGGRVSSERVLHWRFGAGGSQLLVEIAPDAREAARRADAEQAERFARAVALALAEPQPPSA